MQRFRTDDEVVIENNPAFTLGDKKQRELFKNEYQKSSALYYAGQPHFEAIMQRIQEHIHFL